MVLSASMQPAKRISASEFKAKCLRLMDQVAETGASIVITKNGKAVARLGPIYAESVGVLGLHKNQIDLVGDVIAPTGARWNAT